MRILLIRHGQSLNNLLADGDTLDYAVYMSTRVPDPPLTPLGKDQAARLAQQFAAAAARPRPEIERLAWVAREHPVSSLYVSPMLRALQTADPIARALGLAPQVWIEIHEHGGLFTGDPERGDVVSYGGLNRDQMADLFPGAVAPAGVHEGGWWMGGYEEIEVCHARASGVAARLRQMAAAQPDDTIAMVSHGTFLDRLLNELLQPGRPYREDVHFSHLNTAVSRVDFLQDGNIALRYLNRIDHLPAEMVSR